jgi:hypothetical protein
LTIGFKVPLLITPLIEFQQGKWHNGILKKIKEPSKSPNILKIRIND